MSRGRCRFDRTNSASPGGPAQESASPSLSAPAANALCSGCETGVLTFRLRVSSKHTLQADAYTLHVVDRTPALLVEKVETYYPIAVDVRVERNLALGNGARCEDDFRRFDGI